MQPLRSAEEIVSNVLWRFLHLRDYVDDAHHLTKWGRLLFSVLERLPSTREEAEAALLAVELLRLGLLSTKTLFSKDYGGAAVHGSGNTLSFSYGSNMTYTIRHRSGKLLVGLAVSLHWKNATSCKRI